MAEFDVQSILNEDSLFSSVIDNKDQNFQFYTPPISRKSSVVGIETGLKLLDHCYYYYHYHYLHKMILT